MLYFRTLDRHRMRRGAVDFAALFGGLLDPVMMVRLVGVVRRHAVIAIAHVVSGLLGSHVHPGIAMKTRGIGSGEQTRLKSRHQEHNRQHCSKRYLS